MAKSFTKIILTTHFAIKQENRNKQYEKAIVHCSIPINGVWGMKNDIIILIAGIECIAVGGM